MLEFEFNLFVSPNVTPRSLVHSTRLSILHQVPSPMQPTRSQLLHDRRLLAKKTTPAHKRSAPKVRRGKWCIIRFILCTLLAPGLPFLSWAFFTFNYGLTYKKRVTAARCIVRTCTLVSVCACDGRKLRVKTRPQLVGASSPGTRGTGRTAVWHRTDCMHIPPQRPTVMTFGLHSFTHFARAPFFCFLFLCFFGGNCWFAGHDCRAIVVVQCLLDEVAIMLQKDALGVPCRGSAAVYLSKRREIEMRTQVQLLFP